MGLSGINTNLTLTTVFENNVILFSKKVGDREILSFGQNERVGLTLIFAIECIPARSAQIPRPEIALKGPFLMSIANKIFHFQSNAQVALLIGNNALGVMRSREIVSGGVR